MLFLKVIGSQKKCGPKIYAENCIEMCDTDNKICWWHLTDYIEKQCLGALSK